MEFINKSTLLLASNDVEKIMLEVGLDKIMDSLIDRLDNAFKSYSPENISIPIRSGFNYEHPEQGLVEWMPLYEHGNQVVIKIVGYHPDNPDKRGLPTILSTISNYDTTTGHLKGIVDGVFLTALRTGAASALASRYLALPESRVLGLIGCGAQSLTQLHALSREFTFEKVLYYDTDIKTMSSFPERAAVINLDAQLLPSDLDQIVRQSDILCTATSVDVGGGPVFEQAPTKEYLHVNAVGSDFPGKTELPLELLKNSALIPDFKAQAIKEGECQQLEESAIKAELFECIQYPDRYASLKYQRTVFDSTGLALEDKVVMNLFLEHASALGLGTEIELESMQLDAKNPYQFLQDHQETEIKHILRTIK